MLILILFAFISGLVTILAPCIWPLLPIILSSSATNGGRRHPLGLTLGVMLSFGILTLSLGIIAASLHINAEFFRYLAVAIILFFGFTLVIPKINAVVETMVSRMAARFSHRPTSQQSGFVSGFLTGLSLGVVWTPCAGPILATIATLAATNRFSIGLFFVTCSYVLGVGIPLLILSTASQRLIGKSRGLSKYTGRIQQVFGVIMLLTAVLIGSNYDKVLQAKLLNTFPQFAFALNQFESAGVVKTQLDHLKGVAQDSSNTSVQTSDLMNAQGLGIYMPEFIGISHWLNTAKPLSRADLQGKVVLVDFWTYTCINCIRTLPSVTSWYNTYKDRGFVVIGVHTPEFAFEHETANVAQSMKQFGIHYPVAQDNDFATWNAYSNQYWPAEYLFDATGKLRRTHFGEGDYDRMEMAIQALLKESGQSITSSVIPTTPSMSQDQISPETYLGTDRLAYAYPAAYGNGQHSFTLARDVPRDHFSLGGQWMIDGAQITSSQGSTLLYQFQAANVYLVLRPPQGGSGQATVLLDGKPIATSRAGQDVTDGHLTISSDRLYHLVDLHNSVEQHTLELHFANAGIQAFAFTFGT